jgi:hypothetical protein
LAALDAEKRQRQPKPRETIPQVRIVCTGTEEPDDDMLNQLSGFMHVSVKAHCFMKVEWESHDVLCS